ncbi:MAG: helix-turn-helix domain-containing protein [Streptococcaceae bacterium]|jgi:hypothetical protein|nr:helix-turn-helix domain-containing protein [Streptococcaceae bacterium]
MIYDAIMFDSVTNTKIELYSLIAAHQEGIFSVHYFGDRLFLNYHQVTRAILEIDKDLKEIDPEHGSLFFKAGKIKITNTKVNIDEYRRFLLKSSVPYQFILECLQKEPIHVNDFCNQLNISRSTLARKMQPLTDYLKEHDLRITYTPFNIQGDEALIRHSIWILLWLGLRGNEWPILAVDKQEAKKLAQKTLVYSQEKNFIANSELLLFVGVVIARWNAGFFCRKKYQWDKIFSSSKGFNKFKMDFDFPSEEIEHNEHEQVIFLSLLAPHYTTDSKDLVELLICELYEKHSEEPYAIFTRELMNYLTNELFYNMLSAKEERVILANILSIFYAVYTYSGTYPTIEELSGANTHANRWIDTIQEKILAFYEQIHSIDKTIHDCFYEERHKIIPTLGNLLLPYYYFCDNQAKLRVAISMERNKTIQQRIKMFLSMQSFVELYDFNGQDAKDYDLVISTSTSVFKKFDVKEGFLWDANYGYQEIGMLFQILQNIWFRNNQFKNSYY